MTGGVACDFAARTKAVRTTIHEMAQKGIPAFVDRAGREWSPEAYVNMDIRATVKNTALEAKFSVMDSLGQDVFEVSSHPGSRPKCRPWQGKLISRSGKTTEITDLHGRKHKVIPLSQTSFGEPDGLFGINCGHRPRGCTEGVFTKSAVEYDDAEDKELYNKVCRQRELERRVRKSKTEADMLEAAGDAEGAKEVRRRMAEQNKALRAYCEENGLKFRSDRVRTYGAVEPKKSLDKSAGSGIMEREREFGIQYGDLSFTADKDFISSKEYANLFFNITNNRAVNDSIADLSRKAILHRNGSKYEDMYIVNANTGEVMGQQLDMQYPSGISYNDSIKSALSRAKEANIPIIAIHNHPEGYPPSIDDFNKAYDNNYFLGIACGHNGQVYVYDKPEFRIAQTDADEIHEAMNLLIDQGADPDRIYREHYNELGLSYRIEKGGGDNGNS